MQDLQPSYQILSNYSHLVNTSRGKIHFVGDGGLQETIDQIKLITRTSMLQVKHLAAHLFHPDLKQAAFNVWHWMFNNLRYHLDKPNYEQIRTPARTFVDGIKAKATNTSGIDCEDLSIFAFSLLRCMGYSPVFNIVAMNGREEYGHIFVTLGDYTIDPCPPLTEFDQEAPQITKRMKIEVLDGLTRSGIQGIGAAQLSVKMIAQRNALQQLQNSGKASKAERKLLRKLHYLTMLEGNQLTVALRVMQFVDDISPRANFIFKPGVDQDTVAKYAMLHNLKEKGILKNLDESGISGLGELGSLGALALIDYDVDQLSNASIGEIGNIFKKIGHAVSNTWHKVQQSVSHAAVKADNAFDKAATNTVHAVGEGLKNVGGFLMTINPLSVLMRNAYLLCLKMNIFKQAKRLKYGYLTEDQARSKGLNLDAWRRSVEVTKEAENKWDKFGGNRDSFKNAVMDGGGNLAGLGEPVTIATITAGLTALVTMAKILKGGPKASELKPGDPTVAADMDESGTDPEAPGAAEGIVNALNTGADLYNTGTSLYNTGKDVVNSFNPPPRPFSNFGPFIKPSTQASQPLLLSQQVAAQQAAAQAQAPQFTDPEGINDNQGNQGDQNRSSGGSNTGTMVLVAGCVLGYVALKSRG